MQGTQTGRLVMFAVFALAMGAGCNRAASPAVSAAAPNDSIPYVDPPAIGTFPSGPGVIQGWIDAMDTSRIRQHGWDIWASITSPARSGNREPVWETWFAGNEVFMDSARAAPVLVASGGDPAKVVIPRARLRHPYEVPRQAHHDRRFEGGSIPVNLAERTFSFNRFTQSTAKYIVAKQLADYAVMQRINQTFNKTRTPIALRQVLVSRDSVDALSIVLKPVFQFISGSQPSCLPYWNGDSPVATGSPGRNPVAVTWKQYVIVDPRRTLKGPLASGKGVLNCPGGATMYPVVTLDRFYAHAITASDSANFSAFAAENGDDIGTASLTDQASILAMVRPGNFGLLVAMHVTGKEIVNWTWQSFWWSPFPNDSLGRDRPASIASPWNNYQMTTAYYMTAPASAKQQGAPVIAYNPYLETSLSGQIVTPDTSVRPPRTRTADTLTWFGPGTNCMTCHRMAAWKDTVVLDSMGVRRYSLSPPPYYPAAYMSGNEPRWFSTVTKTDFLWSVAIRTRIASGVAPAPPR